MPPLSKFDVGACLPVVALVLDASPGLAVKATAGLLYGFALQNGAAAITYVQFFDAAAVGDVNLGTTSPTFVVGLAASAPLAMSFETPVKFKTGLVVFSTTTATGSSGAQVDGTFFIA